MKASTLHNEVLPTLVAGTARRSLPGPCGPLEQLALAGQAIRFERPAPPASFAVEPETRDDRRPLAEGLRRPLIRLLVTGKAGEPTARALARTFDALALRPHPFDLPQLDGFVRLWAEQLGPTAQRWANRQKPPSEAPDYFDEDPLNESNWMHGALSRRAAFLDDRRRTAAAAARALLAATWGQETADARFRLLRVLETGLGAEDLPFLTMLEKDRAPRVRGLAARLMARIGHAGENAALKECLGRIQRKETGLFFKTTVLALEAPANLKDEAISRWVRDTFGQVSFAELSAAFQLEAEKLIDAAAKQDDLLLGFAVMATAERRLDLLERVAAQLPAVWMRLYESGLDELGTMRAEERERWAEIVVTALGKGLPPVYQLWDWLHRLTDCAFSPAVMETALRALPQEQVENFAATVVVWAELLAAACPRSQRGKLREALARLDGAVTGNAFALLEILDGMENQSTDGR